MPCPPTLPSGLPPQAAKPLSWPRLLSMAGDAAKGMLYLHTRSPPVFHRDLKSANLLVTSQWQVKVGGRGGTGGYAGWVGWVGLVHEWVRGVMGTARWAGMARSWCQPAALACLPASLSVASLPPLTSPPCLP